MNTSFVGPLCRPGWGGYLRSRRMAGRFGPDRHSGIWRPGPDRIESSITHDDEEDSSTFHDLCSHPEVEDAQGWYQVGLSSGPGATPGLVRKQQTFASQLLRASAKINTTPCLPFSQIEIWPALDSDQCWGGHVVDVHKRWYSAVLNIWRVIWTLNYVI